MQEDTKYNSGIIYVHFPKDGKQGCEKQCAFCIFNKISYNIPIIPTDNEIINFITKVRQNGLIQISGAGDPLFNFEENKDYLTHIIHLIKSYGYEIMLVTKYYEVVEQYYNTLLSEIDVYSFSCEAESDQMITLITNLAETKQIRLTKLYNYTKDLTEANEEAAKKFSNFYLKNIKNKENISICFRLNYNFNDYDGWDVTLASKFIAQLALELNTKIYLSGPSYMFRTRQLWNNREIQCCDTQKIACQDMGIPYEENNKEESIE